MSKVKHRLYEISFDCLVDTEDGLIEIVSIDAGDGGAPFTRKTKSP